MYSIGVIALELFQPFGTEMERVRTLGDLREGKVPDSFHQRWPVLSKYIKNLTSKEPSVRLTATQLLQSELFSSKDMVFLDESALNTFPNVIYRCRMDKKNICFVIVPPNSDLLIPSPYKL